MMMLFLLGFVGFGVVGVFFFVGFLVSDLELVKLFFVVMLCDNVLEVLM